MKKHNAIDEDCLRKIQYHDEMPIENVDPFVKSLHLIIRMCVKFLAVLMVLVIIWGIGDVVYVLYRRVTEPPLFLLNVNDIFETFGAFMAVLIAIEIFINIRLYLGTNIMPVKLVVATALMAISRKVIILDFDKTSPDYILGMAAVVLGLGISYWLISRKDDTAKNIQEHNFQ